MSKKLEKANSLFNAIKKLKHKDCANFLNYLDDRGVELLCRNFTLRFERRIALTWRSANTTSEKN